MKKLLSICAALIFGSCFSLQASGLTCTSSWNPSLTCFDASSFTGFDSLDWGAPVSGTGQSGFGVAIQGNTHGSAATVPWDARTTDGNGVQVSLMNPQLTDISRVDNTYFAGTPAGWNFANTISQAEYGSPIYTYSGHFGSPTTLPATGYTGFGDNLIAQTDDSGVVSGGGEMKFVFDSTISSVGFRISSAFGTNSNFDAILNAYDAMGNLLGWYEIFATGSGGRCTALTTFTNGNPGTCNDAPWIGFTGLAGVKYFTVDVFSSGELPTDYAFLVDGLQLSGPAFVDSPEPAVMGLIGSGLLALALLVRKRRAASVV
jgi:hypothetical protein